MLNLPTWSPVTAKEILNVLEGMLHDQSFRCLPPPPLNVLLKTVFFLLCFFSWHEMYDIKYRGGTLSYQGVCCPQNAKFWVWKQLIAMYGYSNIFPTGGFWDGPAFCQHSLLANHSHITCTHRHRLCFCTLTSCHSNWEAMRRTGGSGGWPMGPSRGLRAPFISLSKANWDYQTQAW